VEKKGDVESPEGGDLGFGNPLYSLEDIPGLPRAELQDEVVIEKTASGFANPLFEEKQTAKSDVTIRDVTADDSTI